METYTKSNVTFHEFTMYQYVRNLNIVNIPELLSYDPIRQTMCTRLINNVNLSDMWTDDAGCVPDHEYSLVVDTIKLLKNANIMYPDITGYNFIYDDNKMWVIDFEHAIITDDFNNLFIHKFCQWKPGAKKIWNPLFE